jgi:hypothetical protein
LVYNFSCLKPRQKENPGFGRSSYDETLEDHTYTIVMNRKSRVIMKGGHQLLSKVEKIKTEDEKATISIRTTAPICSKTKAFLEDQGISVASETA